MRSVPAARQVIGSVAILMVLAWGSRAHAQLGVGKWERTDAEGKGITMIVEPCCNGGYRLTYQVPTTGGQPTMAMTVDSPMNGTEVPALVAGQPSGETMAIKRLDDHHYSAVVKMSGKPMGTSNGTLSADGKTLTVVTVTPATAGMPAEKIIETWVRK